MKPVGSSRGQESRGQEPPEAKLDDPGHSPKASVRKGKKRRTQSDEFSRSRKAEHASPLQGLQAPRPHTQRRPAYRDSPVHAVGNDTLPLIRPCFVNTKASAFDPDAQASFWSKNAMAVNELAAILCNAVAESHEASSLTDRKIDDERLRAELRDSGDRDLRYLANKDVVEGSYVRAIQRSIPWQDMGLQPTFIVALATKRARLHYDANVANQSPSLTLSSARAFLPDRLQDPTGIQTSISRERYGAYTDAIVQRYRDATDPASSQEVGGTADTSSRHLQVRLESAGAECEVMLTVNPRRFSDYDSSLLCQRMALLLSSAVDSKTIWRELANTYYETYVGHTGYRGASHVAAMAVWTLMKFIQDNSLGVPPGPQKSPLPRFREGVLPDLELVTQGKSAFIERFKSFFENPECLTP